jgi:hypothetical protein
MASAAQLTVNSTDIVAGVDAIADCDADGVTVAYSPAYDSTIPGYTIDSITINDLEGCSGTVLVTVTDAADAALADGSIAYADGSVTVDLSVAVEVADIYGVAIAIG